MSRSLNSFIAKLQTYSNRWWYVPLMGFFVFIDLFLVVIPSEAVMMKTILLKPKRWLWIAAFMTFCSAFGALVLGYLAQHYGQDFVQWLLGDVFGSSEWVKTQELVDKHGGWGLAFISFSPLPQQLAVVVCALAHMPLHTIFISVFLGRAPKYFLFALLALRFPHLYDKYFKKALEEAFPDKQEKPAKKPAEKLE